MRAGRTAALASVAAAVVATGSPAAAAATRQSIVFVLPPASYEQVLRAPAVAPLARAGGIGLMTTRGVGPEGHGDPVAALSAGATGDDARPGALAETLGAAGLSVALVGGGPASPGRALAADPDGMVGVVAGGALPDPEVVERLPEILDSADLVVVELGSAPGATATAEAVSGVLEATRSGRLQVMVLSPRPSRAMRVVGDAVTSVVVAEGSRDALLSGRARASGLTSDTTRREGLVSNADVAPTILAFLGVPAPDGMTGSPVRLAGVPPTGLHARYLDYVRIRFPVQIGLLVAVLAALAAGLVVLFTGTPSWAARAAWMGGLAAVAATGLALPAGALPRLSYWAVVPFLVVGAGAITALAVRLGRTDPVAPVAVVAGSAVVMVAIDGILGWPGTELSIVGGSAFEGIRFHGLGNSQAGVLLGGAVLLASRLMVPPGTALLVLSALFAGLPGLGADLGGGVALFAAAALWFLLGRRGRLGVKEAGVVAAAAAVGGLLLVVAHRVLPGAPTHVGRAAGEGVAGAVAELGERLLDNLRSTSRLPSSWLPVALAPAALWVALRRWGPFGPPLRADPDWRHGCIVLGVAALVGFVANDTAGTLGLAFVYLLLALVSPAVRVRCRSE